MAGPQLTLHFPSAGMDVSTAFMRQKPRQIVGNSGGVQTQPVTGEAIIGGMDVSQAQPDPNMWARTTPLGINVRGFDPVENRRRGGSRCGLSQWIDGQVNGSNLIQNVNYVIVGAKTMPQPSSSGYVSTLTAVCQGYVFYANSGDTVWSLAANDTTGPVVPPLNATGVVNSSILNQCVFYADGKHWTVYSPQGATLNQQVIAANSVATLTPGTQDLLGNPITSILPADSAGNTPRLIATWRTRLVVAGLLLSPQAVFMSAQGDPTNWDYSPEFTSTSQAADFVETSPNGQVGDLITTLIPYTDDILVIGGQNSIYMLNGDPMNNGQLSLISTGIGMIYGNSWAKDGYGNIYFISNKVGIYTMVPGQQPVRISQQIEQLLLNFDTGQNTFTCLWNDRFQGLHVFITPTAQVTSQAVTSPNVAAQPVTHFFYETRTGAWWMDEFANPYLNPLAGCELIGNTPSDRVPIIGSWDGFVRAIDPFAVTDDGTPIESQVLLGPILTQDTDAMRVDETQGILGETSGPVNYGILTGRTPEMALASSPVLTGTFQPGRNPTDYTRTQGHALYIDLTSNVSWSMEAIRFRIAGLGPVRRRSQY